MEQGITRRSLIAGGAAAGLAAALGIAATGTPFGGGPKTLAFWHLFGGGDGARLTTMLDELAKEHDDMKVRSLILPWGNPYYTKLSLAAVGGSPPDVAISHATRLAEFAPANLLEPLPADLLDRHGIGPDKFNEAAWKLGTYDGKQYAIPLDTHPFVLYVNTKLAKQAGLLDSGGTLKQLDGPDALLDAFQAVKQKTNTPGIVLETRGVTPWRLFLTLYTQLGGKPVVTKGGTDLTLDDAKALKALEWMAQPHARKAGGQDLDYQASVALFGNGSAGFLLNGEWEVTTYQAQKMAFDMRPVPAIFDSPTTQADSHTFVIPRNAHRSPERLDTAVEFIARLVKKSLTWTMGGHVPAYKPVFDSAAYRKLQPQSHYAAAASHIVTDPLAWYSGSGSNLEAQAGSAFQPVVTGAAKPQDGLATFKSQLKQLVAVPPPV
jgi:multiple sugar transport system substrate-binding protein